VIEDYDECSSGTGADTDGLVGALLPLAFDAEAEATAAPNTVPKKLYSKSLLVGARARFLATTGDRDAGRELLSNALRSGGWNYNRLWWELVALIDSPEHYEEFRALWRDSPKVANSKPSLIRAAARAAGLAGAHDECRALLRKNIIRNIGSAPPKKRVITDDAGAFISDASVALRDLYAAFGEHGTSLFLISGTLLGLVREGTIIGWDKDIDVGVFTEQCPADIAEKIDQHPAFRIGRVDLTSDRLRLVHSNGVWIDVFPHYLEDGLRWHNGTVTRWWNSDFGLRETEFVGVSVMVPDDPELYLDENYGDWRTPNSNFDARIDAPNAEIIDPEHFHSQLLFSLESSQRQGKHIMQARYTELLRAAGEGSWLDRLDPAAERPAAERAVRFLLNR